MNEPPSTPWRIRDFRIVWAGGLVNDIGDWFLLVALPVYVFTKTGSGSATAIMFVIELVAGVVFGPLAGGLVDRWDLRRTLVATNLLQAVALLPLLAVTPHRIWPAFGVAAVQAALKCLNDPAKVALLPRLVDKTQLVAANAANATSASIARLVGSPLGGIAVALGGLPFVVAVDGASFLLVALATSLVRVDTGRIDTGRIDTGRIDTGHVVTGRVVTEESAGDVVSGSVDGEAIDGSGVGSGVKAGLRIIGRQRSLFVLNAVAFLSQIGQGLFVVLFVVFVVERLDGGGTQIGLIRGSMAVGALAGAALVARFGSRKPATTMFGVGFIGLALVSSVFWNLPAATTRLWPYVVLFALSGLPGSAIEVGFITIVQQDSPPGAMGRVIGVLTATSAIGNAIGALAAGFLLHRVRLSVLLNTEVVIYVVCGSFTIAAMRGTHRRRRAASTAPPVDQPLG